MRQQIHPRFGTCQNCSDNWKKATKKFTIHESSSTHRETKLKWSNVWKPSIRQQVVTQVAKVQAIRREGLLKQLSAIRFLLRKGIAMRRHTEEEGNLFQLLTVWSNGDSNLKYWLREKKYLSPVIVSKLITMMGLKVLRSLLEKCKRYDPAWYAVIADEATDVANREQFTLSIRSADDDYDAAFFHCHFAEDKPMMGQQICKVGGEELPLKFEMKYQPLRSPSALVCPLTEPLFTGCWEEFCTATKWT